MFDRLLARYRRGVPTDHAAALARAQERALQACRYPSPTDHDNVPAWDDRRYTR